jgi:hypothetical protein
VCSSAGTCVECTGKFDSACGTTEVCDERPPTAVVTSGEQYTCAAHKAHTATACEDCVSDAQCMLGQVCVLTSFGGTAVGYYCLYRKVDAADLSVGYVAAEDRDAEGVSSCVAQAAPYVATLDAVSVSGESGLFCSLRTSTCEALAQFSERACQADTECGVDGVADAKCVAWDTEKRCSPLCVSSDDCPVNANGVTLGCSAGRCSF